MYLCIFYGCMYTVILLEETYRKIDDLMQGCRKQSAKGAYLWS